MSNFTEYFCHSRATGEYLYPLVATQALAAKSFADKFYSDWFPPYPKNDAHTLWCVTNGIDYIDYKVERV